ncbi:MAG: lysoplasmalogenase [Pseudomonadota bacterium]
MNAAFFVAALAAGPLASVVYWLGFSWRGPSNAKTWVKALPMGILFVWLLVFRDDLNGSPIAIAVLAAWIGDVLLSRPGERAFLLGMVAFAVAHGALISVFEDLGMSLEAMRWGLAAVFVLAALATATVILPRAGALRWPVAGYMLVILAMALAACAISSGSADVDASILIAAALFVLSDALIAIQSFRLSETSRWHTPLSLAIWPTYYVAMVLFAAAAVG